jgi:hypothetical protein
MPAGPRLLPDSLPGHTHAARHNPWPWSIDTTPTLCRAAPRRATPRARLRGSQVECGKSSLPLARRNCSSVPSAPSVMSSGARLQPLTENSRRPRDAWRWLPAALAIVMLSSVCCVSTAQGTWTTAQLSVGRRSHAATSVGNVAIFAGGAGGPAAYTDAVDLYSIVSGLWTTARLSVARAGLAATSVGIVALFAGGQTIDNSVAFASDAADLYNSATASWSTARLSVGRYDLAATSLGRLAIFAGGHTGNAYSDTVDLYNSVSGAWTTARLSAARRLLVATNAGNMAIFAGGLVDPSGGHQEGASNVVDLYNNVTNTWSTAQLSAARYGLVATSLGNLAFFAGGFPMDPNWQHDRVDLYNSASGVWSNA